VERVWSLQEKGLGQAGRNNGTRDFAAIGPTFVAHAGKRRDRAPETGNIGPVLTEVL